MWWAYYKSCLLVWRLYSYKPWSTNWQNHYPMATQMPCQALVSILQRQMSISPVQSPWDKVSYHTWAETSYLWAFFFLYEEAQCNRDSVMRLTSYYIYIYDSSNLVLIKFLGNDDDWQFQVNWRGKINGFEVSNTSDILFSCHQLSKQRQVYIAWMHTKLTGIHLQRAVAPML